MGKLNKWCLWPLGVSQLSSVTLIFSSIVCGPAVGRTLHGFVQVSRSVGRSLGSVGNRWSDSSGRRRILSSGLRAKLSHKNRVVIGGVIGMWQIQWEREGGRRSRREVVVCKLDMYLFAYGDIASRRRRRFKVIIMIIQATGLRG